MINRLMGRILMLLFSLACGYEYTNKFHSIFTEMNVSKYLNEKFTQYCKYCIQP
jgi:hypothetical protein